MATDTIMSSLPQGNINSVHFYITGDEENTQDGFIDVLYKDTFKSTDKPYNKGVYDARMGTTDNSYSCMTCFNRKDLCPGHAGYIQLKYPVQNSLFKDDIFKWLKIICHNCGHLLTTKNITVPKGHRMREYIKLARTSAKGKGVVCSHCAFEQYAIVRDKHEQLAVYKEYMIEDKIVRDRIMNREIASILDKISPETLEKLGRPIDCHPRKFILNILNVPSNVIRPDMKRIGGSKTSTNDLTMLIKTIVNINTKLPENITEYDSNIIKDLDNLDLVVFEMIRGSSTGTKKAKVTHSSGQAPASIASRLPKKPGRVRGSLMGKRVHNCCRSVISGDPSIEIDEVGVPLAIAKQIQIPITVHSWNINELNIYFHNKDKVYPGCTKIIKNSTKSTYYVGNIRSDFKLEEGDILYRDLINGDVMAFNRAPSLSLANIGCHKVRIRMKGNTLSFNLAACNKYNADFDGDEMNGYFPLSVMSKIEIEELLSMGEHMISHQYGNPMVGSFQDALIGGALFTFSGEAFSKFQTMRLFSNVIKTKNLKFNKKNYTNYELISMILPNINFKGRPSMYDKNLTHLIKYNKDDVSVLINKGVYLSGILDKKTVGQSTAGSLIHIIRNKYGSAAALEFVYLIQQIITMYLKDRGFSIGIKDILISKEALKEVHKKTSAIIMDSQRITDRLNRGEIVPPIGMTTEEYYEQLQMSVLNIADDFYHIIIGDIDTTTNRLYQIITSGSKGNTGNLLAISSAIGQQKLGGIRIAQNFGDTRTLPYYTSYDTNPEARGFVPNSYIAGLGLSGFIFSSMDARFALIKNALSTSVTGAQNRTSIKNLESTMVDNLRSSVKGDRSVQVIYGESGIDPRATELSILPLVNLSNQEFSAYHIQVSKSPTIDKKYNNSGMQKILDDEFAQLKDDRDTYRNIMMKIEDQSGINNRLYGNKVKTPLHMKRIIYDTVFAYGHLKYEFNPGDAVLKIRELCDGLAYTAFNDIMRQNRTEIPKHWKMAMTFTCIKIRNYLNVKNLLENKISNFMLNYILDQIKYIMSNSFMDYGSAVGIHAAQSLSEPMTQFILDSKHRSGGDGTKTDKLVRMAEILGARPTENMKNPSMSIQVKEDIAMDGTRVQEVANHIEMMEVGRFITNSGVQLFYERIGEPKHSDYIHESKIITDFKKNNPTLTPPGDLIPWCIRFELDRKELILKNVSLSDIVFVIQKNFPNIYLVYTPETAKDIIIRCYMRATMVKKSDVVSILKSLIEDIKITVIRGVPGIIFTEVNKKPIIQTYIADDGSMKTRKIYTIDTAGTNLPAVLNHPMVDKYHIQSDSILEIADIYGIEAAREKILNELKTIISATMEKGPSHQHYTIYADEMTSTGYVTSIERSGLSKREMSNVLLRVSNASPVQALEDAAIKGTTDNLQGVSALLMIGQIPKFGSAYNDVMIDNEFVKQHTTNIGDILDDL